MRYIDADALMEKVGFLEGRCVGVYKRDIEVMPTADVAPVVHARWIAEQKGAEYCGFRCSECDSSIGKTDQFDETEVKEFSEWFAFCPSCGARMDGGT